MKEKLSIALIGCALTGLTAHRLMDRAQLPTGKFVSPNGAEARVGSFPVNMVLSPDGRFVVVTDSGSKEALSVLDAASGKQTFRLDVFEPDRLYYGLAFGTSATGDTLLYASHGDRNSISAHRLTADGMLESAGESIQVPKGADGSPYFIAGLAVSDDGKTLYAVENESFSKTGFKGAVAVIDLSTRKVLRTITTPGFPLAIACAGSKLYVSCEMEDCVAVLSPEADLPLKLIRVGSRPVGLTLNKQRDMLYVACANSDSLCAIDAKRDRVARRLLVRPAEAHGLPGCTPLSACLSRDESHIYVPLADWNAVAVVSSSDFKVEGYVPSGWYPTCAVATDQRLFVSNARGSGERNPNASSVKGRGQYILAIMDGAVTCSDLAELKNNASELTTATFANNRLAELDPDKQSSFKNPGIDYVIYIIKENRTFDQVFGDIAEADADRKLCLFGESVTPNQHALARRFGIYDNFFVCAEVSADGWNWSTAGMANEYTSRNTVTNYTGGGRSYDFEGEINGSPVELEGRNDVAEPPGGFIWDLCKAHGVSYRNYGFFNGTEDSDLDPEGKFEHRKNEPVKKALAGHTCLDFYQYDTAYADSEAWTKHKLQPTAKQMKEYGKHRDPDRFATWKREYDGFLRHRNMPKFMMVRFMRDHTAGTAGGLNSPRSMVADNDYAVGELVDAVTHGPLWKRTAIFILEDDAQAGHDHVDAHRSFPQVITPYALTGVHHEFYNTDSVLHTMELLLGLPPMCQYDAIATPFSFSSIPVQDEPFDAILPAKQLVAEVNSKTAYRTADSTALVSRFRETDQADMALNDILWHSIKGVSAEMPRTPGLKTR